MNITQRFNQFDSFATIINRHRPKFIALAFWLLVLSSYWAYTQYYGIKPADSLKQMSDWFVNSIYGPPTFILIFMVQPLVFFPTVIMGITAGCLYGPFPGIPYAIIGANGAAWTCYAVGQFFGQGLLNSKTNDNRFYRYTERLRHHTFEAMLTLTLLFAPFDLLSYTAGFLQVKWKPFAAAIALGSLPGIVTFVLFGASLEGELMSGSPQINYNTLAISGVILIVSLSLSRYLKWRERKEPVEQF